MAVPKETHLERLAAAERVLYKKLSDIKSTVELNSIVWKPPGYGMEYWNKGLRFRLAGGGKPMHFKELDTEDLRTMMERFDGFVEYVKQQQGLDIEPPPAPPGPGVRHYIMYVVSKSYRNNVAEIAKEEQARSALEKLRETKDDARKKLDELEAQEKSIIREGKSEKSIEIKKRLAGRLASLRKDISREDSMVKFTARQIGRCEDYLHTRKMVRLAGAAGLPDTDEIIENQVEAELAIEAADAAAEAADSVEFDYLDEEAEACMKEFEETEEPETEEPETEEPETEEPETEEPETEELISEISMAELVDNEKADKTKHTA